MQLNYLWLYLDFSAYSDIAVGVGRLMGVATPENFNRPYLARNMIDFWERWHISLSLFIRRNMFIPIQLALMRRTDGRRPLLVASVGVHRLVPALRALAQHRPRTGWPGGPSRRRAGRLQPLPGLALEAARPQGGPGVPGEPLDTRREHLPDLRVRRVHFRDGDLSSGPSPLVE